MSASLSGVFNLQEFTDLGAFAVGGRIYTYAAGTTTLKVAYTDAAGTIPHTYTFDGLGGQYIALNSRGELAAPLFLVTGGYDITLRTAAGNVVWTRRAIGGNDLAETILPALAEGSDSAKGDALVAVKQPFAGSVPITQHQKNAQTLARPEFGSDAAFNAAKVGIPSLDALGRWRAPTFVAGTEELSGSTLRDAFVVGRNVIGATNCHGFADRTIMSGVTDGGFYGSFDCTVELQGTHNQNHVYSFQDRVRYSGGAGGVLQNSAGFLSQSIHSGAGTILSRNAIQIDPMSVTGGGTITEQTGIRVNHQGTAANNVGVYIGQTTASVGWAMYVPGGGKSYHLGQIGFGMEPGAIVPLSFKDPANALNLEGFLSSDLTRVTLGGLGDARVAIVTNGQARVVVENAAGAYSMHPNADNGQSCGSSSFRWSVVYAGTGTINTSDERLKEQFTAASAAEKRVALAVKGLLRKFKFKDAVLAKGSAARWHVGVGAQSVAAAFRAENLDPNAYGLFCYDEWPASSDTAAGNRYGIRYEELAMFILAAI